MSIDRLEIEVVSSDATVAESDASPLATGMGVISDRPVLQSKGAAPAAGATDVEVQSAGKGSRVGG